MKTRILLVVCLAILFSGCSTANADVIDPVVCEPPCWRGITPGITTIDEAVVLMNSMDDIDHESMEYINARDPFWDSAYHWDFIGKEENTGFITEKDGKIATIQIGFGEEPKLSKVINYVGYPDYVLTDIFALDNVMVTIELYYSNGLCAGVYDNYSILSFRRISPTPIQKNTRITHLTYFDNQLPIDEMLNVCWYFKEKDHVFDWIGYGEYEVVSSQ